ncbi:MAG: tRNA (adenosine(37)-N6)-dimethylallyltransferase MiaA [Bacillota bacterium]
MAGQKIAVIVGPTACGKTDASIRLAEALDAEIISADSIQVYRLLDIGSAKPTADQRRRVVHHMVDVVDLGDRGFSVARYRQSAQTCIDSVRKTGKLPLIVGGTGLYIHALTQPLALGSVPPDEGLRMELVLKERNDPGCLHRMLGELDPASALRLHPNDQKRVIRALEVCMASGKPLSAYGSDFQNAAGNEPPNDAVMIGIAIPRELLYERINARVDQMMEAGFLDEVKTLLKRGYDPSLPAFQGIGYRQLLDHLDGRLTMGEAMEEIKRETRRFAKRQITWFKRDARIRWFNACDYPSSEEMHREMLEYLKFRLYEDINDGCLS